MMQSLKAAGPFALLIGVSCAMADGKPGYTVELSPPASSAGSVAAAGLVAHLSDDQDPPIALYGFVEIAGEREHVALATCADVDTDEFLPEGIAVPFVCDGTRFVVELGEGQVDFFEAGREEPVASIPVAGVDWINGLPVGRAASPEPQRAPASIGEALLNSRRQ